MKKTFQKGSKYNLIVQTAFLGDLCLSVPLMKHIRRLWPDEGLILVCRSGIGDMFLQLGLVDQVIEVRKNIRTSYRDALTELAAFELNRVFVPHMSMRSAAFVWQLSAQERIGFSRWWNGPFFTTRSVRNESIPDALRQLSLLTHYDQDLREKFLLWETGTHFYQKSETGHLTSPPVWASMGILPQIQKVLHKDQLLAKIGLPQFPDILIFPGSVWATKRWTELGYIQIASTLRQKGLRVALCGSESEVELCERIAQKSQTSNIASKLSLTEILQLMSQVQLVIGNDSGSSHLAALAEVKNISIFGPTVLSQGYRPWSDVSWVVEVENLGCRPCGKHGHKKCPLGSHECMKHISDEQVMVSVSEALRYSKK